MSSSGVKRWCLSHFIQAPTNETNKSSFEPIVDSRVLVPGMRFLPLEFWTNFGLLFASAQQVSIQYGHKFQDI